jgi:hypothetical protein
MVLEINTRFNAEAQAVLVSMNYYHCRRLWTGFHECGHREDSCKKTSGGFLGRNMHCILYTHHGLI